MTLNATGGLLLVGILAWLVFELGRWRQAVCSQNWIDDDVKRREREGQSHG